MSKSALCLLASLLAVPSFANLINNGDFESSSGSYTVSSQGLSGWTVVGSSSTDEVYVFGPTVGLGPQTNSADLGGFQDAPGTGIEQSISTVAGTQYSLKFDYWTGADLYPSTLDVFVDGAQILDELSSGSNNLPLQYTYNFTATSSSTVVKFAAGDLVTANDVDNISVEAVPEPVSILVLAAGCIALAKRRRP